MNPWQDPNSEKTPAAKPSIDQLDKKSSGLDGSTDMGKPTKEDEKNQGLKSMVVSGSPKRWNRWHSPCPQLAGEIPLIVLAEPGELDATDPTF